MLLRSLVIHAKVLCSNAGVQEIEIADYDASGITLADGESNQTIWPGRKAFTASNTIAFTVHVTVFV